MPNDERCLHRAKCDEFGHKCTPHAGISKIIYLSDKTPDRYMTRLTSRVIGVGGTTDKETENEKELLTRYTRNETQ